MGAIFSRGKAQGKPHLEDIGIDGQCVIQKLQQFPHDIVPPVKMDNIINQCKIDSEEEMVEGFGHTSNQNMWIFIVLIVVIFCFWYTNNKQNQF